MEIHLKWVIPCSRQEIVFSCWEVLLNKAKFRESCDLFLLAFYLEKGGGIAELSP
jgi:hypothetical protein